MYTTNTRHLVQGWFGDTVKLRFNPSLLLHICVYINVHAQVNITSNWFVYFHFFKTFFSQYNLDIMLQSKFNYICIYFIYPAFCMSHFDTFMQKTYLLLSYVCLEHIHIKYLHRKFSHKLVTNREFRVWCSKI